MLTFPFGGSKFFSILKYWEGLQWKQKQKQKHQNLSKLLAVQNLGKCYFPKLCRERLFLLAQQLTWHRIVFSSSVLLRSTVLASSKTMVNISKSFISKWTLRLNWICWFTFMTVCKTLDGDLVNLFFLNFPKCTTWLYTLLPFHMVFNLCSRMPWRLTYTKPTCFSLSGCWDPEIIPWPHLNVKNSEGSLILSYFQANMLVHHGFMNLIESVTLLGKRPRILLLPAEKAAGTSCSCHLLLPPFPQSPWGITWS